MSGRRFRSRRRDQPAFGSDNYSGIPDGGRHDCSAEFLAICCELFRDLVAPPRAPCRPTDTPAVPMQIAVAARPNRRGHACELISLSVGAEHAAWASLSGSSGLGAPVQPPAEPGGCRVVADRSRKRGQSMGLFRISVCGRSCCGWNQRMKAAQKGRCPTAGNFPAAGGKASGLSATVIP
jgi:hypothetical protein